jgi:hypothetical protein
MQIRFLRQNKNPGCDDYASRCSATGLKGEETLLSEVENGSGIALE